MTEMERPPDEPEDPAADTARFRAFVRGAETRSAREGAPKLPAGIVALLLCMAVVVVAALLLLRG